MEPKIIPEKEQLAEITKNSEAIAELLPKIQKIYEDNRILNGEEKGYRYNRYSDDWNTEEVGEGLGAIKEELNKIHSIREDLKAKLMIILGLVYEGTLIDDKMSLRKGKIYPFRHRYRMDLKQALDCMLENKDEVVRKLANKKDEQILLAYVFNAFKKMSEIISEDNSGNLFVMEQVQPRITIVEPDLESDGTGGAKLYYIDNFTIRGSELNFCFGTETQEIDKFSRRLLEKNYEEKIMNFVESSVEKIKGEQKKYTEMIDEINTKFAKQLVYADLLEKQL